MAPAGRAVGVHDALQRVRRGQLRALEARLVDAPLREKAQAVADAAHGEALHQQRLQALADDALGRAAADVDYEPALLRRGELVRDAEVDEARLLAAEDHFHGKAEDLLRLCDEG